MAKILNLDPIQNTAIVSLNDGTQVLTGINSFPFQVNQGMEIDLELNGMQLVGIFEGQQYTISNFQGAHQTQSVNQVMTKIAENKQAQAIKQTVVKGLSDSVFGKTTTIIFTVSVIFLLLVNIFATMAGKLGIKSDNLLSVTVSMDNNFALHTASLFNVLNIIVIFVLFGVLIFKAITNLSFVKKNVLLYGVMAVLGLLSLIIAFVVQGLYWALESVVAQPFTQERASLLERNGVDKIIESFGRGDYGWSFTMQIIVLIFGIIAAVLAYLQFFKWPNENVFTKLKNMISQQNQG